MIQEKPYKILLDQMDNQLKPYIQLGSYAVPPKGWIYPIRRAIRMKYRQMGERLGMSAQGAKQLEESEIKGTVSIKTMKAVAEAMDMDFVYGFVPREGSLTALMDKQARKKAIKECTEWGRTPDERSLNMWIKLFKEEPKYNLWDSEESKLQLRFLAHILPRPGADQRLGSTCTSPTPGIARILFFSASEENFRCGGTRRRRSTS